MSRKLNNHTAASALFIPNSLLSLIPIKNPSGISGRILLSAVMEILFFDEL